MTKSKIKTMLVDFLGVSGLVRHEYVPLGTPVIAKFYVEVQKRLKHKVVHRQELETSH